MSKRLSKYIASFDYIDKSLNVLFAISGSISMHHLQQLLEQVQVLVLYFQFLKEL